jgi:hypothetical protein
MLLLAALVAAFPLAQTYGQKISVDEIIQKHLESIGTSSDRGQVRNTLIKGDIKMAYHGYNPYKTEGKVVLASEANKVLFRMAVKARPAFNLPNATENDSVVFDGSDIQVGPPLSPQVRPGAIRLRSDFEDFIDQAHAMVKDGILGGTLFTGWNLADRGSGRGKLEYDGIDNVDGEKMYVLKFNPGDGASVKIKLFFDTVNFQHRRTEYYLTIRGASGGSIGSARGVAGARESLSNFMKFTEEFSDFRKEGQLTLPHKYTIYVKAPVLFDRDTDYTLELKEFFFNVPFDPASFNITKN